MPDAVPTVPAFPEPPKDRSIYKAVKITMVTDKVPLLDKFQQTADAGFDGVSLLGANSYPRREVFAAQDKTGMPVHNVNHKTHWRDRLSDADPAVRARSLQELRDTLAYAADLGGSSMLLVVGKVTDDDTENHEQVRTRSSEAIRAALPDASRLGVRILCENVKNGFCSTAEPWRDYIDAFNNPWLGAFFDIGNHDRFGGAPHWIRTLGPRIAKLDVKDHDHSKQRNCNLFDGDVDWPEVRKALKEIGYVGWATAEVRGGDQKRLTEVASRMDRALGLS